MGGFGESVQFEKNGKFWEASELLRKNVSRDNRIDKLSKEGWMMKIIISLTF